MFLLTKFTNKKRGNVTLRLKWNDDKEDGKSVKKIFVLGRMFKLSGDKGKVEHTIDIEKDGLSNFDTLIEQGIIDLGTKRREGGKNSSNKIFADYLGSRNDNDDMQIKVKKGGVFTARRRRKARGRRGGRSTFDLEFIYNDSQQTRGALREEITRQGLSDEEVSIQRQVIFNTKEYINKSNRDKLFRVNSVDGGKLGDFYKDNAVTPFNPLELDADFSKIKKSNSSGTSKPQVKFVTRSGVPKLKIIGAGKVKVGFKLKVNDNLTTSGVFARQVDIQSDTGLIQLKRNISERKTFGGRGPDRISLVGSEEETLFGVGEFTGGQEYDIKMIQGSAGSGFKTSDKTVVFDDDIGDGIDENGLLNIDFITNLNPKSESSVYDTNDYAGTYNIVWRNVVFPVTGNYQIEIEVDDEVELQIGNSKKGTGYVELRKVGFTESGRPTGKSVFTEEIEKGEYNIRAALKQKAGKPIIDGNPMGVAINIKVLYGSVDEEVIVRKSWNENPFGVALTINAPVPPVPTEPIPPHDGPCPPSPFWHTRYQNVPREKDWFPVNHRNEDGSRTWSRFMNRYAVSPILPLDTKGSGSNGGVFTTRWDVDIPYQGYYTLKGASDNSATVRFIQGNSFLPVSFVLDGFKTEKKDLKPHKVFLTEGKASIEIALRQGIITQTKNVLTKVFHTADWVAKPTDKGVRKVPVDFNVFGAATNTNRQIKFIFNEIDGPHKFTVENVQTNKTSEKREYKVKLGVDYNVTAVVTGKPPTNQKVKVEMPITYNLDNPSSFGYNVINSGSTIEFDDNANDGFDTNSSLKIVSKSPGVTARFSSDSKKLIVNGPDGSDISIRFKWNDRSTSGRVFKTIEIGGALFKQDGTSGDQTKTIKIGSTADVVTVDSTKLEQGVLRNGQFGKVKGAKESGQGNPSNTIFADYIQSANDDNDMQIQCEEGKFTPSNKSRVFGDRGRGTWDLTYRLDKTVQTVNEINEVDGATYKSRRNRVDQSGVILQPKLATYKRGKLGRRLSPFFKEGKDATKEIQGKTWEMTWENVNFPITGDYTFEAEADDRLFIDINDQRIGLVRGGSVNRFAARITKGEKKVKLTLTNLKFPRTSFRENPTYAAVKITCLVPEQILDERSWRVNPTGVSAVLIPPPCRRAVGGIGTVPQIIVTDPGGGFNPPPIIDVTPIIPPERDISVSPPTFGGNIGDVPTIIPPPPDVPTLTTNLETLITTGIGTGTPSDGDGDGFGGGSSAGIGTEGTSSGIAGTSQIPGQLVIVGIHTLSSGIGYTDGDRLTITPGDGGGDPIEVPISTGEFGRIVEISIPRPPVTGGGDDGGESGGDGGAGAGGGGTGDGKGTGGGTGGVPGEGDPRLGGGISGGGITVEPPPPFVTTTDEGIPITVPQPPVIPPQTRTPIIDIISPTGVGFKGVPIYELVLDPLDPEPGTVIQITDLVGLKQTGYVQGRAYYGEVYYENGIRFAGRYKTAGTPIQVFDTLLESIEGEVTTRPSAIQRSGTDVTNNDPRLNIPGTPENLS